jgi:hypothetical protein
MTRRRLNASQREELWQAEAAKACEQGRGPNPICNLCTFDILPGSEWHESHDPLKPKWLGGEITGIAHAKCNRRHNNQHDTPLYARNERVRKRFMDFRVPQQQLPGGRDDRLKKKMNGRVVERWTP